MELSYLLDDQKQQSGDDLCQVASISRQQSSIKGEKSQLDKIRVKRNVQFPSDDNLVFIREIPPRGFYGSDVSDSDDSSDNDETDDDEVCSETEDDDDEEDTDCDDDDDDDNEQDNNKENNEEEKNDNEDTLNNSPNSSKIKITSRQTRPVNKPLMTGFVKLKPEISKPLEHTKNSAKRKTKRPRLLIRNQNLGNRIDNGSKRNPNKSKKNVGKSKTIMKPTISSQTKQITKINLNRPVSASQSANRNTRQHIVTKSPSKITIDSPIPLINNNRVSDENSVLYNYYVSGKMCQVKGFVFPIDHNDSKEYLPNINGINNLDFKPFSKHRRSNAWQLANGTLDSTLFHTPSIAPMWENIQTVSMSKLKQRKYDGHV